MRITADIIDEEFVTGCSTSDKVIQPETAKDSKQPTDERKSTNIPFVTQVENNVRKVCNQKFQKEVKTYDPLKSCRPECWLRQSILQKSKFSLIQPNAQDSYSARCASTCPYDPTYRLMQQTYRMREMCNKFKDLKLSDIFENIRTTSLESIKRSPSHHYDFPEDGLPETFQETTSQDTSKSDFHCKELYS